MEPRIPTDSTFCKPDMILVRGNIAYVMDTQICGEAQLDESYNGKVRKYANPRLQQAILSYVQTINPEVTNIEHRPVIINLRGIMHPRTAAFLKQCQLRSWDMSSLCIRTVVGSIKAYDIYMRGN